MSQQYLQGIREALTRNATKTSISHLEKQGLQSVRVIRAGRILELIQEAVDRHLDALGINASESERQTLIENSHATFGNLVSAEAGEEAIRKALERAAHLEGQLAEAHRAKDVLNEQLNELKTQAVETNSTAHRGEVETLQQRIGALTVERNAQAEKADELLEELTEVKSAKEALEEAYQTLQESFETLSREHEQALESQADPEEIHQLKTQLDSITLELTGVQDEKASLEAQLQSWREDPLSIAEVNDVLASAREELEELTQKFEEVQRERDELEDRIGDVEEREARYQSLDEECRELRVRLDEARQSTARLEQREENLREEREQIKATAAAKEERSFEVITSMFDEIRGLKKSLASGELAAANVPKASSSDSDVLAKLTKDLADRIDKIGKKVGVGAIDEDEVSLDAIFNKELATSLDSNITNVKVTERKSESGSSVSDALQRMKKLKKGAGSAVSKDKSD